MGTRNPMVGVQETNDWSPTDQWLVPTKPMVGVQEINGWGPGNQWLRPRKPMVGVKEMNGRGPGQQWWGPRKAIAGPGCSAGGDRCGQGEAASERSMCKGLGREREEMAGERSARTSLERDGEGGIECERENDSEKAGDGKGIDGERGE